MFVKFGADERARQEEGLKCEGNVVDKIPVLVRRPSSLAADMAKFDHAVRCSDGRARQMLFAVSVDFC